MPRYQFNAEAIHADWPVYPAGHGAQYALETLCCFPFGTHFKPIDEIDQCLLFIAVEHTSRALAADEYSNLHHHVALWQADLLVLRQEQWLEGFQTADGFRRRLMSFAERMPAATRAAVIEHARTVDWEAMADADRIDRSMVSDAGLSVTQTGWQVLWNQRGTPNLHPFFAERVKPLLGIGFHDSAVREAALLLECYLRERTGTDLFGQQLVSRYIESAAAKAGVMGAFQRHLRSELRTLFAFVRNEFAHNIVSLEPGRCHAILKRISTVYEMLDDADEGVGTLQDMVLRPLR